MRSSANGRRASCGATAPVPLAVRKCVLVTLAAACLPIASCGRDLFPVPAACPPCLQTAESSCTYVEMKDGTRIRTQYTPGEPGLPLLVAVHGFGGTYENVSLVFPPGSFPTLSFSMPGSLCSDFLPDGTTYTIAEAAKSLEAVLEQRQDILSQFGEGEVVIVGASFGALVVVDYFAAHPDSAISAVVVAGQDTPVNNSDVDWIGLYLDLVANLFPLADNSHLQQYLESSRTFDVSSVIGQTQNRWLVIEAADDAMGPATREMMGRLGDRAKFAELPGNHFDLINDAELIRQAVTDNLDFLLHRDGGE
jgi:pimeloyl-ACP methyl ester carboxylesterase